MTARPMTEAVEAARRIVAWDDAGRLADDEWLVERNESAIIAIARALLSTSAAERGMREALESIWQYGSDTLSGRADGGPDDRQWQRDAVLEMTRRASAALSPKGEGK